MRLIELRLGKEWQQAVIASVAIHYDDLLAAVARHFIRSLFEKRELHFAAVGHGSGLVLGFGNLSEIIFRENDCVLLFGSVQRGVAHVQQIGSERQMRAMLFKDAEWQQAGSLRSLNALAKIGSGEFFPMDGELGLRRGGLRSGRMRPSQHLDQNGQEQDRTHRGARTRRHRGIPPAANSSTYNALLNTPRLSALGERRPGVRHSPLSQNARKVGAS